MKGYGIVVVGGGILGVSLAYFLACLNPKRTVALVEREGGVARHASGRNTGKVHAPYLYDPEKKPLSARSAFLGYSMWEGYARSRGLPFVKDGVIEVALNEEHAGVLKKYQRWGRQNGLEPDDMEIIEGGDFQKIEPNVQCRAAMVCGRDASVDYRALTEALAADAASRGVRFLHRMEATGFEAADNSTTITLNHSARIAADFMVNAAGGQAIDVAHEMGLAGGYTDLHFRGEYWRAPPEYAGLTGRSVYSVPQNPAYPFLDPHWIVRHDRTCEVGPNAVPVFSPYGYDHAENARRMLPKVLEMLGSGAIKTVFDAEFRSLVADEMWSAISKQAMVDRVRRFIPALDPDRFVERGTAGIRTPVIDGGGHFVSDVLTLYGEGSVHILNYNSPGATGALPFAAHLIESMHSSGAYCSVLDDASCGIWRFAEIVESMKHGNR